MAARELRQKNFRAAIMLTLTLMLVALTSLGIVELRYTMVIWSMASIHGAYITDMLLQYVSTRIHRKAPKGLI